MLTPKFSAFFAAGIFAVYGFIDCKNAEIFPAKNQKNGWEQQEIPKKGMAALCSDLAFSLFSVKFPIAISNFGQK